MKQEESSEQNLLRKTWEKEIGMCLRENSVFFSLGETSTDMWSRENMSFLERA